MDMSSASSVTMPMSSANPSTSTMSMPTMQMQMTFFTSTTTPLYSASWSPSNTGQYAGTCIFLIVLATVLRILFAFRVVQERRWQLMESKRRYVIAGTGDKGNESRSSNGESKTSISSGNSDEVDKRVSETKVLGVRPWRTTQDIPRACQDVVIAGVGYLLMLAVMTFNVGYFMSVLGGSFLGSLVAGRFAELTFH